MSVIRTLIRLRRAVKQLDRLVEKPGLLVNDDLKEIKIMVRRLNAIELNMLDRADKDN